MTRIPNRARQSRLSPGFSLMETLIVLVVLGFVLGFTGLRFDSYRTQLRLQNQARLVQAHVQRAQLRNAARGTETVFDAAFLAEALRTSDDGATPPPAGDPVVASVVTPLLIKSDGACTAGRIEFSLGEFLYALDFAAPFCSTTLARVR